MMCSIHMYTQAAAASAHLQHTYMHTYKQPAPAHMYACTYIYIHTNELSRRQQRTCTYIEPPPAHTLMHQTAASGYLPRCRRAFPELRPILRRLQVYAATAATTPTLSMLPSQPEAAHLTSTISRMLAGSCALRQQSSSLRT